MTTPLSPTPETDVPTQAQNTTPLPIDNNLKEDAEKEEKLNLKQEAFCQLYVTPTEFFGNGVQTYIEVYQPDQTKKGWYNSACASASQILSNIKICNRINELLEEGGFNDQFSDKQLKFLMTQNADFKSKLGALKEFNRLKQRIVEKTDLTSGGEILSGLVTYRPEKKNE